MARPHHSIPTHERAAIVTAQRTEKRTFKCFLTYGGFQAAAGRLLQQVTSLAPKRKFGQHSDREFRGEQVKKKKKNGGGGRGEAT